MVRFGFSASDSTATSEELSAQFERWIAAHDREIKRSALLEWTNYQESMMDAFAYVLDDEDVAETKTWVAAVRSYVDMFYPT
jgi:protein-disulfide isomerase-like protein with CxxC motif